MIKCNRWTYLRLPPLGIRLVLRIILNAANEYVIKINRFNIGVLNSISVTPFYFRIIVPSCKMLLCRQAGPVLKECWRFDDGYYRLEHLRHGLTNDIPDIQLICSEARKTETKLTNLLQCAAHWYYKAGKLQALQLPAGDGGDTFTFG